MNRPIKNQQMENIAHKIADAIYREDSELYAYVMEHSEKIRSAMVRWELLAFRDRVHYLVNNHKEISL